MMVAESAALLKQPRRRGFNGVLHRLQPDVARMVFSQIVFTLHSSLITHHYFLNALRLNLQLSIISSAAL